MATSGSEIRQILAEEFENWLGQTGSEAIYLLENEETEQKGLTLLMLLAGEYEFELCCPSGYPDCTGRFSVTTNEAALKVWEEQLNKYLHDESHSPRLAAILSMAEQLHTANTKRTKTKESETETESEMEADEDEDHHDEHSLGLSDDESVFTTEWELNIARKKKRWCQKEQELREELKRAKLDSASPSSGCQVGADNFDPNSRNIFTSYAASGVLINDLVKIMQYEQDNGFNAEPVSDNIYQWCVKMYNFNPGSDLCNDLHEVQRSFGYKHIELELDFTMDLYPFYPPLLKVIRPRLQGSMMQRVTNMEMLKLSFWNPTKDMMTLLQEIKSFLQQWARLETNSERNNRKKFPRGSYVSIEHDLLRLALVSEINPRANSKYQVECDKPPDFRLRTLDNGKEGGKKKEEYWAAGVGFGHSRRPEWDIKAYLAAQKEKDKQIETVLHSILKQLKELYANHAPQLKPLVPPPSKSTESYSATVESTTSRLSENLLVPNNTGSPSSSSAENKYAAAAEMAECSSGADSESHVETVDPVEDMYNILEGSALIPFAEQYLGADSFLEICRHTVVYKAIVDILREIALQNQLVPLLAPLPDQSQSVYQLLKTLEGKANTLLQHICKAGNGHVPKPPKSDSPPPQSKKPKSKWTKCNPELSTVASTSDELASSSSEEKLAREFQVLFKDVLQGFKRAGIDPDPPDEPEDAMEAMRIPLSIADRDAILEEKYKKALEDMQFDTCDIELTDSGAHKYAKDYQKQGALTQAKVFRIAQEVTSLASSLPINLRSSIFVRTDDEKLTLMRALIIGPEGTPYSNGCFLFDIYFPPTYPELPPKVNLQTTGNGSVRFNPNLYNCGKVCLSLLGTWEGQQGEQWNPAASTILQVLVSIQSLILVSEPYFNEPGYEQEIGTTAGKRHSAEYNSDVRINNIKYAMVAQLKNPSQGFEDVIKTHFYMKKDRVLQEIEGWIRTDPSAKLERCYENLKTELAKLKPLPNVANIMNSSATGSSSPAISGGSGKGSSSASSTVSGSASSASSSKTVTPKSETPVLGDNKGHQQILTSAEVNSALVFEASKAEAEIPEYESIASESETEID